MNHKARNKILKKKTELEKKIDMAQLNAVQGFKITDIPYGIMMGILIAGVLVWIPLIGWVGAPLIILISPFIGTHLRKQMNEKSVDKLEKELSHINKVLKID